MNETEPALPDVWTAHLDNGACDQLLSELQTQASILSIREKQSALQYSKDGLSPVERFKTGQSYAIQICYLFQGKEWCDTLVRQPTGIKLVRTEPIETSR